MVEATSSSRTSVKFYESIRRNIADDKSFFFKLFLLACLIHRKSGIRRFVSPDSCKAFEISDSSLNDPSKSAVPGLQPMTQGSFAGGTRYARGTSSPRQHNCPSEASRCTRALQTVRRTVTVVMNAVHMLTADLLFGTLQRTSVNDGNL